jgi:hypothetical protein
MQRLWLLQGLCLGALGVLASACGDSARPDDIIFTSDGSSAVADSSTTDARVAEAGAATDAGAMVAIPVDASRADATVAMDAAIDASGDASADASSDASSDASADSSADAVVAPDACSMTQCTGMMIGTVDVGGCCLGTADAGAACGLIGEDLKKVSPSSPFIGCVAKETAQASASSYCGEIWDQIETNGTDNGGLDLKAGDAAVIYEGCCQPSGECGARMGEPRAMSGVDLQLGCVSYTRVRADLKSLDGGAPPAPTNQPFCNPADGGVVTEGTVPGVPKPVCGCGADTQPTAGVVPTCLGNFPKEVCGRDDPSAAVLATIPEIMCGCTASSTLPCLKNVAHTVCGTKPITSSSSELDALPEYVCGCGATAVDPGGVIACLSNVETNVCGKINITNKPAVAALPEYLCGCGNNKIYDAEQVRCLSNVDAAVCGGKNITEGTDPTLTKVPEFLCGCGDTVPYNQQPLPCLPNVANGVCGALDITAASQADLSKLPSFVCGCGNGKVYDPAGSYLCLSNVVPEICGGLAIVNGNSPWLEKVPTYRCGCTGASFQYAGCLANTQSNICGRLVVQITDRGEAPDCLNGIPEYVRGCGTSGSPTANNNPTCLKGIQNLYGCVDTAVNTKGTAATTDDCLDGVLSYLRGCGDGVATGAAGCLPNAHTFWGCDQVTTSVPQVREHICGCGEGVLQPAAPAYPCMSNVALTVCGAVPVTRSQEVDGVPNTVCGCGDGVVTGANCVRNVPPGVCGATPTCNNTCRALFGCQDNYGTNASGARGDGIGDTCP